MGCDGNVESLYVDGDGTVEAIECCPVDDIATDWFQPPAIDEDIPIDVLFVLERAYGIGDPFGPFPIPPSTRILGTDPTPPPPTRTDTSGRIGPPPPDDPPPPPPPVPAGPPGTPLPNPVPEPPIPPGGVIPGTPVGESSGRIVVIYID